MKDMIAILASYLVKLRLVLSFFIPKRKTCNDSKQQSVSSLISQLMPKSPNHKHSTNALKHLGWQKCSPIEYMWNLAKDQQHLRMAVIKW